MNLKKIFQISIILACIIILVYSYYYIPNQNLGSIKIEENLINSNSDLKNDGKTSFVNTEYKTENRQGQIYITRTKESFFYQNQPDIIYLIEPYSFTKLKKDLSIIEIKSKKGIFDKSKKNSFYEKEVTIKNKNYIITANSAKHFSEKNVIIINGNVVMKDLTMGLSHVIYCDIVEINTSTNDIAAFMNSKDNKVIAKKFK